MPDDLDGRGVGVRVDYGNTQEPIMSTIRREAPCIFKSTGVEARDSMILPGGCFTAH
jgi:hypothetical protein